MKMACVIVLYNPSSRMITKLLKYKTVFDTLIIVDNSNTENRVFSHIKNIIYIPLGSNMGIAYAQNVGINKASDLGYEWVMTLDQDSEITKECVDQLKITIESRTDNRIAIVSANYEAESENPLDECDFAISSGSVLNIQIFKELGGFINELFIDHVDTEYCIRVISKGYKIIRDNNAKFIHKIGDVKYVKNECIWAYPSFRYYYYIRNSLIVSKMYEDISPIALKLKLSIFDHIKVLVIDDEYVADKRKNAKMAILDYLLWESTKEFHCHIEKTY